MFGFAAAGFAALSAVVSMMAAMSGTNRYQLHACETVASVLRNDVVGQDLALRQLEDAVCHHLKMLHPSKPLVLSAHGPPGVGKTLTHTLLAKALYNKDPKAAFHCPGRHCMGYKVLYGLDFIQKEREQQLGHVRDAVIAHIRDSPEPLLVIEEYDKLDCNTRAFLRQLLQHPELANTTFNRGIVMLESNLGMTELAELLSAQGSRDKVSAEDAERQLKNLVFETWSNASCESFEDTLKMTSLVDFYLPYFPLGRQEMKELFRKGLAAMAADLARSKGTQLLWGDPAVEFLLSKVEFDGKYPLEGAKPVERLLTRYLDRLIRELPAAEASEDAAQVVYQLKVDRTGKALVLQRQPSSAQSRQA